MQESNHKMKQRRNLKNFLINPRYQLKYIFWLTFTGFLLIGINAFTFYWYVSENYAILVELSPMTDEAKNQLYSELNHIVLALAIFSGLFLAAVATLGVILSHRTAGPMFHFKRVFKDIRTGKKQSRIHLRPNDDFQDVAQEFNSMMDSLK